MDALTDVLRAMRLSGGVFLDAEFTEPWCIISKVGPEDCRPFIAQPAQLIAYHYVVEGRLLLHIAGQAPVSAASGHLLVLPRNDLGRERASNCCEYRGLGLSLHEGSKSGHIRPQPLPDLLVEEGSRGIEYIVGPGHVELRAKPGMHAQDAQHGQPGGLGMHRS